MSRVKHPDDPAFAGRVANVDFANGQAETDNPGSLAYFRRHEYKIEGDQSVAGTFDPGEHSVDEVEAHLEGVSDAERERVLAAERGGKARKSLVGSE